MFYSTAESSRDCRLRAGFSDGRVHVLACPQRQNGSLSAGVALNGVAGICLLRQWRRRSGADEPVLIQVTEDTPAAIEDAIKDATTP